MTTINLQTDREIFMSQTIYDLDTDLLHSRALEIAPQNNITVELLSNKSLPKDSIYYPLGKTWFTRCAVTPININNSISIIADTNSVVNPLDFIQFKLTFEQLQIGKFYQYLPLFFFVLSIFFIQFNKAKVYFLKKIHVEQRVTISSLLQPKFPISCC